MGVSKGCVSEPRGYCCARSSPGPQANILINHDGHACLADFGLLTIASNQETFVRSCVRGGMIPWTSPERFDSVESGPTKESDCYALGMVICEVLSGRPPFASPRSFRLLRRIMEGQRPERPQGEESALFTDDLWETLQLCWKQKPDERTNATVVLQCLERASLPPRLRFTWRKLWRRILVSR